MRAINGLAVFLLTWCSWASCGVIATQEAQAQDSAKRKLAVCSTTQVADFTRQVVGDRFEVVSILAPGQDPHLYEIKPGDADLAARADLCLENGWHLEGKDWMRTLAEGARKPLVTCTSGAKPLMIADQPASGDGSASAQTRHDPHAWFSPANAAVYVRNIAKGVSKIDPAHSAEYEARAELLLGQIRALHLWIQKQVNALPAERRVLVTSHDAFLYFCRDYGFRAAAPAGWSTGDEIGAGVTAERRKQAVDSIREFGVKAIFVETSVNPTLIREIAADAGVKVGGQLYSDSMGPPGSAGESYIGMMRENVLTIVEALK
jgi:manganese/iron transport system substrate-binding protein